MKTKTNTTNKVYKFRIYPNQEQKTLCYKTFGCVRFMYNTMLYDKKQHYDLYKEILNNHPAQYKEDFPFLKEVDSLSLCNAEINLKTAYANFFKKNGRFPKYKKKKGKRSYTTNCTNNSIRILDASHIKLPKLGAMKTKFHRNLAKDSVIKNVTISCTPTGKFYISICCEVPLKEKKLKVINKNKTIGLDYSSPNLFVDNKGNLGISNHFFREQEKQLAQAQRSLSRKQLHSANWYKQYCKVNLIHEKITNRRQDYLHKLSRKLVQEYNIICLEDINMKNMSRCLRLGKATMDNGFGMFRTMLSYKAEDLGKHIVFIDKWYPSSKTCHYCGTVEPSLTLKDRDWTCPSCGKQLDRDVNAAINIKKEGLRLLSC